MRKLVAVWVLGMGLGLVGTLASPALALESDEVPPGIEKFHRGVLNVALGAPEEVLAHTLGAMQEYGTDTLTGFISSALSGVLVGSFWGVARVGSGIADIFTFPVPFDEDNSPLLTPDYEY